ncbi:unnamed protein product [Ectocarpus sp. 8 AP-2014]
MFVSSCDCRPLLTKTAKHAFRLPACSFRSTGGTGCVLCCCCGARPYSIRRRRGASSWWSPTGISPPSSPSSLRNGSVEVWATATRRRC